MIKAYELFGLPKEAGRQALQERYDMLKAQYSEERFLPGEAGNIGARKLTELENAWQLIQSDLDKEESKQNYGSDYGYIDNLIKENQIDQAQAALDEFKSRDAEWHYYQSIVYYKRDWMGECRKQLVTAVELDPYNAKYRSSLEKLDLKMANPSADPRSFGAGQTTEPPREDQICGGNALSSCCATYCCMECCCTMTRCCG